MSDDLLKLAERPRAKGARVMLARASSELRAWVAASWIDLARRALAGQIDSGPTVAKFIKRQGAALDRRRARSAA